MRLAFARSRPARGSSAAPSRCTQFSQRMPVTWTVSVRTPIDLIIRFCDEPLAERAQPLPTSNGELLLGLRKIPKRAEKRGGAETVGARADALEQIAEQVVHADEPIAVRMDQLGGPPEARRGPAVLRVDPSISRAPSLNRCRQRLDERCDRGGALEPRRLIGHADFERPEAWVRACVPPDARVRVSKAEREQTLGKLLPLVVGTEDRRRSAARQERENLCPGRGEPSLDAGEVRRV